MTDIQIITAPGAFGAYEGEAAITSMLRYIAVNVSRDPESEWAEKYGTEFENDIFLMHPFCWCDEPTCPWCAWCQCPASAYHYIVDGREVTAEEYDDFFAQNVYGMSYRQYLDMPFWMLPDVPGHEQRVEDVNKRRHILHDPVCDFCRVGIGVDKGAGPGKQAPNFWHKPTGLKVRWHKYIGRGEKYEGLTSELDLRAIAEECIASATSKQ